LIIVKEVDGYKKQVKINVSVQIKLVQMILVIVLMGLCVGNQILNNVYVIQKFNILILNQCYQMWIIVNWIKEMLLYFNNVHLKN
jgi:hypothetical protein